MQHHKTENIVLEFPDNGQQFLYWEVDPKGKIIHVEPFGASTWKQFTVININGLSVGVRPYLQHSDGSKLLLRHEIEKLHKNTTMQGILQQIKNLAEGRRPHEPSR